ncbi:hypothetical protein [Streptomyces sp. ST2-7A]|uniref:hypothetical protein n=1 Tax=Streptomyces sp. ST2-7A TaxID=2907214 RepID=UPI001F36FFAA|nr:hypothetical protein [Streptomyces sp. ST2-7A]MCE7081352.1 hypothetical protein [Streptomyces sp. ST2-7A]
MTAVAVEITPRPVAAEPEPLRPVSPEPAGLVIVDDVEALAEGTAAACNDDNPYR